MTLRNAFLYLLCNGAAIFSPLAFAEDNLPARRGQAPAVHQQTAKGAQAPAVRPSLPDIRVGRPQESPKRSWIDRCLSLFEPKPAPPPNGTKITKQTLALTQLEPQDFYSAIVVDVASRGSGNFAYFARRRVRARKSLLIDPEPELRRYSSREYQEGGFFLLRMNPLLPPGVHGFGPKNQPILGFDPNLVLQKLKGEKADIVFSLLRWDSAQYLEQLTQITKPGGLIILSVPAGRRVDYEHEISAFAVINDVPRIEEESINTPLPEFQQIIKDMERENRIKIVKTHIQPTPSTLYVYKLTNLGGGGDHISQQPGPAMIHSSAVSVEQIAAPAPREETSALPPPESARESNMLPPPDNTKALNFDISPQTEKEAVPILRETTADKEGNN